MATRTKRNEGTESLTYQYDGEGVTVIHFRGMTPEDGEVLARETFLAGELPDAMLNRIQTYGLGKWLQDRTSQVTGAAAKLAAMLDYFKVLQSGQWRETKASTAKADPLLAAALAEVFGKPLAAVLKRLAEMTPDERKAIAEQDAVRAVLVRMRGEAAQDAGF